MFDKNILNSQVVLIVNSEQEFLESIRKEIHERGRDERLVSVSTFGILEAHDLARLASSLDRETSFFVKVESITTEAQNALLKLTEEPSRFFQLVLVVASDQSILPTFKSRFRIVHLKQEETILDFDFKKFISSPLATRLEMLADYIEHPDDDEEAQAKKYFFREFISGLHHEFNKDKNTYALKVLANVDSYGGMTAPSYRMFFEYLATNLPIALKK